MHIEILGVSAQRSVIVPVCGDGGVPRMVLSPTGTRFSGPSSGWPSAIPPNRRISVEPQRQPIGKGRQANLADDPSVAKESG
jgi:hypothetical protein